MKVVCRFTLFIVLLPLLVLAQKPFPVQKPLRPYLEKLPAPPLTVEAAHPLLSFQPATGTYAVPAELETLNNQLEELERAYQHYQAPQDAAPGVGSGQSAELAKKMQEPAMQERIKNMSQEERLAFANELKRTYGGTPAKAQPESPEVNKAYSALMKQRAAQLDQTNESAQELHLLQKRQEELKSEMAKSYEQIEDVKRRQLGNAITEEQRKTAEKEAAAQHRQKLNQDLPRLGKLWADYQKAYWSRIAAYDQAFLETGYGEKIKNESLAAQFRAAQLECLSYLRQHHTFTKEIFEACAQHQISK